MLTNDKLDHVTRNIPLKEFEKKKDIKWPTIAVDNVFRG